MKKNIALILVFLVFFSCKKESEFRKLYDCNTAELENAKQYLDFKNNFKLSIPISWKTSKYYSETQSEIFSADTTKQLSKSFILDASYNFGELEFTAQFNQKTDSILNIQQLKKVKYGELLFQQKPAYWYLVKGQKKGLTYHEFNLWVINSKTTYFNAYAQIYGDDLIEERVCEFIGIIDKVEFSQ